jgi:outer membrane protein TolC
VARKQAGAWLLMVAGVTAVSLGTAHVVRAAPSDAGAPLPFSELWKQIGARSPALRGAALEAQAARASEGRLSKHRLPQVYLRGQYANTDDPASAFMTKLRQRKIEATDFVPADLNTPGSTTFGEAALGVTLPLYEGGSGAARAAAAAQAAAASEHQLGAIRVQQYAEAFGGYGALLALRGAAADVDGLAGEVDATIGRYEVGSTANPVGYAGLLGMKSLALRLKMLGNDFRAQAHTVHGTLSALAELPPENWSAEPLALEAFLQSAAPAAAGTGAPVPESFPARSLRAAAEAAQRQADMERSVLKPQVGLFAEGSALSGDRGTGNAYVAGAYLRWNLFAPAQSGADQEAVLRSNALQERANAVVTEDRIVIAESTKTEAALRDRLALLKQSREVMDEQVRTTKRLFANGTINALQLAEAYSKRADLTQSVLQSELALLQARKNLLLHRPEAPHVQ